MSYRNSNFQCILPEETILSIGGLHHKIQSIDGCDLCPITCAGTDAREINTKGKENLFIATYCKKKNKEYLIDNVLFSVYRSFWDN